MVDAVEEILGIWVTEIVKDRLEDAVRIDEDLAIAAKVHAEETAGRTS